MNDIMNIKLNNTRINPNIRSIGFDSLKLKNIKTIFEGNTK